MDGSMDFLGLMEALGTRFEAEAGAHDQDDSFVKDNYGALREAKILSALVPRDLGGGGISHRTLCEGLRILGGHCGSTALALSMHQHLVAAQTWNHLHGKPGRKLLEKVAASQPVLVSTGANDWLASNGETEKAEGGYRVSARKSFASGSPVGDLLMTSAAYLDPAEGWQVLHFPVPFSADGLTVLDDWKSMGMRATGSHTILLDHIFVPEEAVALKRPRGEFHPVFSVIATVACPLIISVYVGVAEKAAGIARERSRSRTSDSALPYLLGEMENRLATAQIALESMIAIANDFDFVPSLETANAVLIRKTIAADASLAAAEKALEAVGGAGFFRGLGLERLIRDLHGAQFHPLPEKRQQSFTGRMAMGLEPVEPMEFAPQQATPAH